MKRVLFAATMMVFTGLVSCSKDNDTVVTVDSSKPDGAFTPSRTGAFTAQNGTPTAGTAELGVDSKGTPFLHFAPNFTTQLATGTVTVYFSTSMNFVANPGAGNPDLKLVGTVSKNGDMYFKLNAAIPANFTHVILWCGTASIPFGNAKLM
jgi:hypothetical protein